MHASLFAVLFEVKPHAVREHDYLRLATSLRPELLAMPGFLQNERFRSRRRPGYLLSLSLWEDEKALVRWRTAAHHHHAQADGRRSVLDDYRIRVAEAACVAGALHPFDSITRQDQTRTGAPAAMTLIDGALPASSPLRQYLHGTQHHEGMVEEDVFDHLSTPERTAVLIGWRDMAEAACFANDAAQRSDTGTSIYLMRVIRDYGKEDRREAPQYFPPV